MFPIQRCPSCRRRMPANIWFDPKADQIHTCPYCQTTLRYCDKLTSTQSVIFLSVCVVLAAMAAWLTNQLISEGPFLTVLLTGVVFLLTCFFILLIGILFSNGFEIWNATCERCGHDAVRPKLLRCGHCGALGKCPKCKYDLRGSERIECPECGTLVHNIAPPENIETPHEA